MEIIRRKVERIKFSPLESVVRSQMTKDFLKEVIRVLEEKRTPYWTGFLQEQQFVEEIAKFQVKHPGAEYIHGTQF